jgi:hypothetical protein
MRVGDPALPLLKPEVPLDQDAERLLRADILRALSDATTQGTLQTVTFGFVVSWD